MLTREDNGRAPVQPVVDVDQLAVTVHALSTKVKRMESWDDRLGSALKRLWHQTVVVLLLLGIVGMLVWDKVSERWHPTPDILPYLYVVDPAGEVLWKGVPGQWEMRDVFILNHLEDWLIDVRARPDDPTLIGLWKSWTRSAQMTKDGSDCRARFQDYMRETDPRQLPTRPRIEIRVMTKKILAKRETEGDYRLSWQEIELGRVGQVVRQAIWEADMTVVLHIPKTTDEAQKTNRYGILLSKCSWSEKPTIGGL